MLRAGGKIVKAIGSSVRREPFTWLLIAGIVAVIVYMIARNRFTKEGLSYRDLPNPSYPSKKEWAGFPEGQGYLASALKMGGKMQQAAEWSQRRIAMECEKGKTWTSLYKDARLAQWKDGYEYACKPYADAAKNAATDLVVKPDEKKYAACDKSGGWCGTGAFRYGYWCKHPSDSKKCCRKPDGRGGCGTEADMARDRDNVVVPPPANAPAQPAAATFTGTAATSAFELDGSGNIYKVNRKIRKNDATGECPPGTTGEYPDNGDKKCAVLKGKKGEAEAALAEDKSWLGCSTDGASDSDVWSGLQNNPPRAEGWCCQGSGCKKAFKTCKCCEGKPNSRGNCPGRGKTQCDGC